MVISYVSCVKCIVCGEFHDVEEDTFLAIHGNITVGMKGGMIGNNFDDEGKLKNVDVVCREPKCISRLMEYLLGLGELKELKNTKVED